MQSGSSPLSGDLHSNSSDVEAEEPGDVRPTVVAITSHVFLSLREAGNYEGHEGMQDISDIPYRCLHGSIMSTCVSATRPLFI